MPLISITPDTQALTLTAIGEFPVTVERLWDAWTDPRKLERFWGPPQWPATFTRLEVREGGRAEYFMTGPEGEKSSGYWVFDRVDAPTSFAVRDGFANEDGTPNTAFPESKMHVSFEATPEGARFTLLSTFSDLETMEKMVAMGLVEGMHGAFGQLDGVLAGLGE